MEEAVDQGASPEAAAARREAQERLQRVLDEKLYLEVFAQPDAATPRRAAARR